MEAARGRAFIIGVREAIEDPMVVTSTFLNNNFMQIFFLIMAPMEAILLMNLESY